MISPLAGHLAASAPLDHQKLFFVGDQENKKRKKETLIAARLRR